MNEAKVLRTYEAKSGSVIVTVYDDGGKELYHVEHTNAALTAHNWTRDRMEAFRYAQFLAAKY